MAHAQILIHRPRIWFTSDYHAFHYSSGKGSILTLGRGRPFTTIEEHNEVILARHNEVVRPGDLVYNLGDYALKTTAEKALNYRRRFIGNQYFILGNHDGVAKEMYKLDPTCFVWMEKYETIKPKIDGIPPILLCHYAMRTWPGSHKGHWQLYGHSHGMLPELPSLLAFDVGVDCWDFRPVSIEDVANKMKSKMPAWEAYKVTLTGSGRAE